MPGVYEAWVRMGGEMLVLRNLRGGTAPGKHQLWGRGGRVAGTSLSIVSFVSPVRKLRTCSSLWWFLELDFFFFGVLVHIAGKWRSCLDFVWFMKCDSWLSWICVGELAYKNKIKLESTPLPPPTHSLPGMKSYMCLLFEGILSSWYFSERRFFN